MTDFSSTIFDIVREPTSFYKYQYDWHIFSILFSKVIRNLEIHFDFTTKATINGKKNRCLQYCELPPVRKFLYYRYMSEWYKHVLRGSPIRPVLTTTGVLHCELYTRKRSSICADIHGYVDVLSLLPTIQRSKRAECNPKYPFVSFFRKDNHFLSTGIVGQQTSSDSLFSTCLLCQRSR